MSVFKEGNRLTTESLQQLTQHADMIECQCPTHLIDILNKIRAFSDYTTECIQKYPNDQATHKWLAGAALNLDTLLSTTIVQLARHEGFIDENNNFISR